MTVELVEFSADWSTWRASWLTFIIHLDRVDGRRVWVLDLVYLLIPKPLSHINVSYQGSLSIVHTDISLVSSHYSSSHLAKVTGTKHPGTLQVHTILLLENLIAWPRPIILWDTWLMPTLALPEFPL